MTTMFTKYMIFFLTKHVVYLGLAKTLRDT